MPEWLKGAGCKPVGLAYVGSNPTLSTRNRNASMSKLNVVQIEEDVSRQIPFVPGLIDKVGIEDLEMPIKIQTSQRVLQLPAHISAMVSLDEERIRGIHMSRIYLKLHDFLETKVLNLKTMQELLSLVVQSQKGLSQKAYLKFEWKWPVKRKALKSDSLKGWRSYPVFYEGHLLEDNKIDLIMGFQITYSSTCPCSASLARALIQQKFQKDFALTHSQKNHKNPSQNLINREKIFQWLGEESSISATPHAQKSQAFIKLKVQKEEQSFVALINEVEKVLGTPVQTAVKKADEQEFARLNSENLMFSEDAVRRIKALLNKKAWVRDFYIDVRHFESLHPFEVACHATKQVPGGFSP